jgi:hypothetical protein
MVSDQEIDEKLDAILNLHFDTKANLADLSAISVS